MTFVVVVSLLCARSNDDLTKQAYESNDDAYRVFRKMLESGHPPDDWDQLVAQAKTARRPDCPVNRT